MMQAVQDGRFLWRETPAVSYLEPAVLRGAPQLRCAFTMRHAGTTGQPLNLSFARGSEAAVHANRQRLLYALGLGSTTLYTVRQVHGNQVCVVDAQALQRGLDGLEADALVTDLPAVPLGVLVADCLPIVLYALEPPVLALIHAGRMGTYYRIALSVIEVLSTRFAVPAERLYAVLGPAIGACCYTLDARAVTPFQRHFPDWERFVTARGEGRWSMSLTTANALQLRTAGVPAAHLQIADICTACHVRHLFSHRAEGQAAGRGMGVAVLRPEPGGHEA